MTCNTSLAKRSQVKMPDNPAWWGRLLQHRHADLMPNALLAVQCVSSALSVRYPVRYPVRYSPFVLSLQYEAQAWRTKEF